MRREGGAFVKAVQKKANPAVKSAVRSVRESSKTMSSKGEFFWLFLAIFEKF